MLRSLKALGVIAGMLAMTAACGGTGATQAPTPTTTHTPTALPSRTATPIFPTPTPTPTSLTPTSTVLKAWKGSGIKTTESFTVGNLPWNIRWRLDKGDLVLLQIFVYREGSQLPVTVAANVNSPGQDVSYVHERGSFYLTINAVGNWEVEVVVTP